MINNVLKSDLENMKRYVTSQVQEITSSLKYDEKLAVEKRMDEKSKIQLTSDLLQLKKERAEIIQKIKRFRTDSLHLQAKKTLEEISGTNNVIDKLISEGKRKPISLLALPVVRIKKKKNKT
jgi:hypothetical protein